MIKNYSILNHLRRVENKNSLLYINNNVVDFLQSKDYFYKMYIKPNVYPYKSEYEYFNNFSDLFFKNNELYILAMSFSNFNGYTFNDLLISELSEEDAFYLKLMEE